MIAWAENVLNLVFTSSPDQIRNIETVPGMLDHDAVVVQFDTTVKYVGKKPHTVYIYKKGNIEGFKEDMEKFKDSFLQSDPMDRDIQAMRTLRTNSSSRRISTYHRRIFYHGRIRRGRKLPLKRQIKTKEAAGEKDRAKCY